MATTSVFADAATGTATRDIDAGVTVNFFVRREDLLDHDEADIRARLTDNTIAGSTLLSRRTEDGGFEGVSLNRNQNYATITGPVQLYVVKQGAFVIYQTV